MKIFQFAVCEGGHHHYHADEVGITHEGHDLSQFVPVASLRKCKRCQKYVCELCTDSESMGDYAAGDEVFCGRCAIGIDSVTGDYIYQDN